MLLGSLGWIRKGSVAGLWTRLGAWGDQTVRANSYEALATPQALYQVHSKHYLFASQRLQCRSWFTDEETEAPVG